MRVYDRDLARYGLGVAQTRTGTATHAVPDGTRKAVCGVSVVGRVRANRPMTLARDVTCRGCHHWAYRHGHLPMT
jgi:hypothetical protein